MPLHASQLAGTSRYGPPQILDSDHRTSLRLSELAYVKELAGNVDYLQVKGRRVGARYCFTEGPSRRTLPTTARGWSSTR